MGLAEAQIDVRELIRSRIAFDAIEVRINEIPGLAEQERAALWLYAWSRQGRKWQRDTADELLEWIGYQAMIPSGAIARGQPPA